MEIAWTALGICLVVGFVFYVLARYWQRLLAHHSWSIRRLHERLQALEEMENPDFRRKLGDLAPSPLEQVYTFSFWLSDRFWHDTLNASPEEREYVKEHGKFLGSVRIERWRSHAVVTVYEVLPESRSAGWQSRSIDVYPTGDGSFAGLPGEVNSVTLWELPLAAPNKEILSEAVPSLELRLEEGALRLCARHGRSSSVHKSATPVLAGESIFFTVPLDPAKLALYRNQEETESLEGREGPQPMRGASPAQNFWMALYQGQDKRQGVDWQLCIRDLARKTDWDRWKVWETWETRRVG